MYGVHSLDIFWRDSTCSCKIHSICTQWYHRYTLFGHIVDKLIVNTGVLGRILHKCLYHLSTICLPMCTLVLDSERFQAIVFLEWSSSRTDHEWQPQREVLCPTELIALEREMWRERGLWIELLSGGTRRAKAKDYCTWESRINTTSANKKEVVPCTRSYHCTMHIWDDKKMKCLNR